MRKILFAAALLFLFTPFAGADNAAKGPDQFFYAANNFYEKQEYDKAIEEYRKILDSGFESGRVYYNMANAYFKLGKIGHAILYYEKALTLMPQDGDLKANLAYAKSAAGASDFEEPSGNVIVSAVTAPFKELSLRTTAILALGLYTVFMIILAAFVIKPVFAQRFFLLVPVGILIILIAFAAFAVKFYNEEIIKRGVVVVKETDSKYEPIEKSTTYYKLREGDVVYIMRTRGGWRRVRRPDNKIGWVEAGSVEEI